MRKSSCGDTMNRNRLLYIREMKDLSQSEMAKKLGITKGTYAMYELNMKFMPLKTLNQVCNIFGVNIDYIFYLSENKEGNSIMSNIDRIETGQRLKAILDENELSQSQVARFLNTSQSTISAYISGKTLILTAFALQLAQKYNFSIDWLIGRSDKKYINK